MNLTRSPKIMNSLDFIGLSMQAFSRLPALERRCNDLAEGQSRRVIRLRQDWSTCPLNCEFLAFGLHGTAPM